MNLVVPRFTRDHACGGIVDGRYLFMVPWRDVSIVGTSHDPHEGGADAPYGGPAHVAALLRDAQLAFPKAGLNAGSVRLVHRGLLPMTSAADAPVALLKESAVVDHAADGCPGLVSLHSVRYTTARPPAVVAVDAVARVLGLPAEPTARQALRLASAGFDTVDALVASAHRTEAPGTTAAQRERLARTYGDDWTLVAARIAADPAEGRPLAAGCDVTAAELRHAVAHEAALTLNDVLLRRTGAANTGHPGDVAVQAAIDVLTPMLGWDAARIARERTAFERVFPAAAV